MIQATNITLRRGTKTLLSDASFTIHPGERVGIVGANGAGKTTLFALFQNNTDIDKGDISIPAHWEIASVDQTIHNTNRIAREFVIDGDTNLRKAQKQREQVNESNGNLVAELEATLTELGHWSAPSRAEQLLAGLGFLKNEWDKPVNEFSGGWQMRLALARALMAPSDLLLLDEPTNHLDLDAMLWLEKWISSYQGTVLTISHDTEFLDSISQHILHFDNTKLIKYKGNYQNFVTQRAERLAQQQSEWSRQQNEIARIQAFIDRFKAKASKASQAQSRMKALERMKTLAPLRSERFVKIQLPEPESIPDPLLTLDNADIGYKINNDIHCIISSVSLTIRGGDRVGVLGINGAGKSSFIKTIANEISLINGSIHSARGLKVGYFAQHQLDILDLKSTPIQEMQKIASVEKESTIRGYLGSFGFSGDTAMQLIKTMSGGEKARLALACILWNKPNLLLLDEPSNHLDIETREALTSALAEYGGSMLLVSHDRSLLRATVDSFLIIHNGKIHKFEGSIEDYKDWLENQISNKENKPSIDENNSDTKLSRKDQRRIEAQIRQQLAQKKRPIERRLLKIEKKMQENSDRLKELDQLLSSPEFYDDDNAKQRTTVLTEHGILTKELRDLEEQWLLTQEQLEAL